MELWSRRKFFLTSLIGSAVAGAGKLFGRMWSDPNGAAATAPAFPGSPAQGKRPLIISSANGLHALDKRSEEHTSELQSRLHLVCRLLLEKKNNNICDQSR